jgi:hypothetical protein
MPAAPDIINRSVTPMQQSGVPVLSEFINEVIPGRLSAAGFGIIIL